VGNGGGRGVRLKQLGGGPGHAGAFYEAAPPGHRAASNGPRGEGGLGSPAGLARGQAARAPGKPPKQDCGNPLRDDFGVRHILAVCYREARPNLLSAMNDFTRGDQQAH
jgi:hypothetical protein